MKPFVYKRFRWNSKLKEGMLRREKAPQAMDSHKHPVPWEPESLGLPGSHSKPVGADGAL